MDIKSALLSLDKTDDSLWTADGAPRIDVISALVGTAVKRPDIINAYPGFSRTFTENENDGTTQPDADAETAPDAGSDDPTGDASAEAENAEAETDGDVDDDGPALGDLNDDLSDIGVLTMDEVRAMTVRELAADPELLAEAIRVADADAVTKNDIMKAAKAEMERAARLASRLREIKTNATKNENPNLEYIRSQNAVRAARAKNAQMFLANGTTPKDVIKALTTKSPLDAAMAGRKAAPGAKRPQRSIMK